MARGANNMAAQRRKIMAGYISKAIPPPIRSQRLEARDTKEAREAGAAREDAKKEGLDARDA